MTGDDDTRSTLSRRQALGFGGALVAGGAATALDAPTASADEASREPAAVTALHQTQAKQIIDAGVRYVQSHPGIPPMYFYVVDESGTRKLTRRMDGNTPASLTLVPIKAKTAAAFRTATADLASRTTDAGRIASITSAGFSLLPGGRPIMAGTTVVGALGVGGGTPDQDDEVCRAALQG